ncbi:MAG: hypothetical protein RM338_12865 [Nostoc sp. DedQUE12a]|nr:hypothetical protein [Nostoc sp. DedQUE12a]
MKRVSDVYDGLRLRTTFQVILGMSGRLDLPNECKNRTAEDAENTEKERRERVSISLLLSKPARVSCREAYRSDRCNIGLQ